ncbi:hypothetical protein BC332_14955 [Capsicum chinense]|nr:hypothetical protein BC332_14955 [Capsicum chinense]
MINSTISSHPAIVGLLDILKFQQWVHLLLGPLPSLYKDEMVNFYSNLTVVEEGVLSTSVKGVAIVLDATKVPCGKGKACTKQEMIRASTLEECRFGEYGAQGKYSMASLLAEL